MMRQYHSIKEEVPDTLLFFRLGDFYEMFYDDAVTEFFSPHAEGKSVMSLVAVGRPGRRRRPGQTSIITGRVSGLTRDARYSVWPG